jgi:hypothetical protein
MSAFGDRMTRHWRDIVNLILGLWLIVSPWILSYIAEPAAAWNGHIVGIIVAVAALAALIAFHIWEEWVNVVLGIWLIVSPFILGYAMLPSALWNQIVIGLVTLILALWTAATSREHGVTA